MKRAILIISVIVLTAAAVLMPIFCRHQNNNNEVVFWTLQMSDFAPYINNIINEFEKQNPDIKIKWVDVPFSEGEKRTLASVLSDNPPDLVNLNPDFSATLAHKGALQEIPIDKLNQFSPEILNSLKVNGKIYSVPWYATSAITIYNKSIFQKAGLQVPQTYKQTGSEAAKMKSKTGVYITLPNITENDTMLKILNKYGISDYNTINSSRSAGIFEEFKRLYQADLLPKETVTMTLQEALEKYMSGNIAMIGAGPNFLNMIKENAPSTYAQTDVAPQITGDLGQNDFSLMNFVIPLRAKQKDYALKFALFLTNEQNQLELAKLTNVLATNKNVLRDNFYMNYDNNDLMSKARVISAAQLHKVNPVFKTQKNQKEINNIVNSAVQKILLGGNTKEILDDTSKNWKILTE